MRWQINDFSLKASSTVIDNERNVVEINFIFYQHNRLSEVDTDNRRWWNSIRNILKSRDSTPTTIEPEDPKTCSAWLLELHVVVFQYVPVKSTQPEKVNLGNVYHLGVFFLGLARLRVVATNMHKSSVIATRFRKVGLVAIDPQDSLVVVIDSETGPPS